ncbi:hypothetical protein FRB99_001793 [Tulasnella sp. 403]|nr:hypothetical protein FRB99_001793 [Tulasnella sp. 403]
MPPYRRLAQLLNDVQENAPVRELRRRAEHVLQALVDAQGPSPEELEAMGKGYLQVTPSINRLDVEEVQAETHKGFLERIQPNNWDATTVAKVGVGATLIGVGAVVVVPAITVAALGAVGFTSTGVAAGSIAAGVQSSMFGAMIPAGSWFAACQAAAMGGIAVAAPVNVAAGTAAMVTGGTVLATSRGKPGDKDTNEAEQTIEEPLV